MDFYEKSSEHKQYRNILPITYTSLDARSRLVGTDLRRHPIRLRFVQSRVNHRSIAKRYLKQGRQTREIGGTLQQWAQVTRDY